MLLLPRCPSYPTSRTEHVAVHCRCGVRGVVPLVGRLPARGPWGLQRPGISGPVLFLLAAQPCVPVCVPYVPNVPVCAYVCAYVCACVCFVYCGCGASGRSVIVRHCSIGFPSRVPPHSPFPGSPIRPAIPGPERFLPLGSPAPPPCARRRWKLRHARAACRRGAFPMTERAPTAR
jgi:hypothetical protein